MLCEWVWFDLILIWQHVYMSCGDTCCACVSDFELWVCLCACASDFTVVCKLTCTRIRANIQTHRVITLLAVTVLHSNSLTQKHARVSCCTLVRTHAHTHSVCVCVQCFQSNLKRVWNDCHIRFSISIAIAWIVPARHNAKIHLALDTLIERWRWLTSLFNILKHFNPFRERIIRFSSENHYFLHWNDVTVNFGGKNQRSPKT